MTLRDEIRNVLCGTIQSLVQPDHIRPIVDNDVDTIMSRIQPRFDEIKSVVLDRINKHEAGISILASKAYVDMQRIYTLCTLDEPEPTLKPDADKLHVIKCRIQSWFDEKNPPKSTVGLLHEVIDIITNQIEKVPDPAPDDERGGDGGATELTAEERLKLISLVTKGIDRRCYEKGWLPIGDKVGWELMGIYQLANPDVEDFFDLASVMRKRYMEDTDG